MEDLAGEKVNNLTQLLVQRDEPAKKKKCSRCGQVEPVENFHKANRKKGGLQCYCKECARIFNFKYLGTEKGMIGDTINGVFNRSIRKSSPKHKKWIPEISRRGVWQIILNHICRMKEKFPGSNGRLCLYCHQPWTYVRGKTEKSESITLTNFSLDRLDSRFTYKNRNIVCCCWGCNHRKGNSTPKDWRMFIKAENEME